MSTPTSPKKLRIGVMLEEVQMADIIGIDIFGNLTQECLSPVAAIDTKYAVWESHALSIEFFYIATTLDTAFMTPPQANSRAINGFKFLPNVTYDDCPRDLDIVLISRPLPSHHPLQADKFMKKAWGKTRVWLTTCIGSVWLASTGLLEGKKVTTNKEFLDVAKQMHPGAEWLRQRRVAEEKEYDGPDGRKGELWTAGGAGAGKYFDDMILSVC